MSRTKRIKGRSIGAFFLAHRDKSPNIHRCHFDKARRQTVAVSLGTADVEQAWRKLTDWFHQMADMRNVDPRDAKVTAILDRYQAQHASKLPSAERSQLAVDDWKAFFPTANVSDLTPARLRAFGDHLLSRGIKPATVNRVLQVGRAALLRAKRLHEVTWVPAVTMLEQDEPPEPVILGIDELARLWNAIPTAHMRLYFILALTTLSRPVALLELTRKQVDFERREVRLNPEGRRQTKKYRPTVAITDAALPWLRQAGLSRVIEFNGKPVASIKTAFRRAVARAGLPAGTSPYSLRRSMATLLRERGISEWDLKAILGHVRPSSDVTSRYARWRPSADSELSKTIDAILMEVAEKSADEGAGTSPHPLFPTMMRAACVRTANDTGSGNLAFRGRSGVI